MLSFFGLFKLVNLSYLYGEPFLLAISELQNYDIFLKNASQSSFF